MTFRAYLKRKREELEMTQGMLSEATGIPKDTISNWEIGRRKPNDHHLTILNEFYGINLMKEYYNGKCDETDKIESIKQTLLDVTAQNI